MSSLADLNRLLHNLIRIGTIAAVDPEQPRARVQLGGLLTDWLPFTAARAGGTVSRWDPVVGEQVMVLCPGGNLDVGVIGPSLYSDAGVAPAIRPQHMHVTYPDGAVIEYNPDSGELNAIGVQRATIKAAVSVTLDTPLTHCTGNLTVAGDVSADGHITGPTATIGGIAVTTHTHGGVQGGGSQTQGPQ